MADENSRSSNHDRFKRLQTIIDEYREAVARGESPVHDEITLRHPDLRSELEQFFREQEEQTLSLGSNTLEEANEVTIPLDKTSQMKEATQILSESGDKGHDKPMSSSVGETVRYFGEYELLEEIARGGMGVVYKAKQAKLNRVVALKMILSGQLAGDEEVNRFRAEAEAAANLDHPGIVSIFEVGEHDGRHYFSMGFIAGRSLADRINESPLEPREAAELLVKIARAVAYANEQGVIHRDLKPGNVLLDERGEPRVADFGLAKKQAKNSSMTATGQILGTPSYMPPEQAAGKSQSIDQRADVYALGAILYAMLTGRPPFQAANPMETLIQVVEKEPVSIRQLVPNAPKDLETICFKALRKQREHRYETAKKLAEDLQSWLDGKPIVARPVGRIEKAWKWSKRNPAFTGLLVCLFLASIVLQQYSANLKRRSNLERVEGAVNSLAAAQSSAVPLVLQILDGLPHDLVKAELESRYATATGQQRLSLAFGLAHYGRVDLDELTGSIALMEATAGEVSNLVNALSANRKQSIDWILNSAQSTTGAMEWNGKSRLAITALHLGDASIAIEMLQGKPRVPGPFDPIQRTRFIAEFPNWSGDLESLVETARVIEDPSFRSGMSLAVGGTKESSEAAREAWSKLLLEWYRDTTDSGIHGAAQWALRQWNLPIPEIIPTNLPKAESGWWVTPSGLTLIRIPAGMVVGGDSDLIMNLPSTTVTGRAGEEIRCEQEFWLCDREVSTILFSQFLEDMEYRGPKPKLWHNPSVLTDTSGGVIRVVSWYEAVMFCNWLSEREGRRPCYEIVTIKEDLHYEVNLIEDGTGYQLPTEAQWEYACRAMTTTKFAFGDAEEDLKDYGIYELNAGGSVASAGTRRCNAWGLFDMHGNLSEWCWDRMGPLEPDPSRVTRGGAWDSPPLFCRAALRRRGIEPGRSFHLGFRLALVPPSSRAGSQQTITPANFPTTPEHGVLPQ